MNDWTVRTTLGFRLQTTEEESKLGLGFSLADDDDGRLEFSLAENVGGMLKRRRANDEDESVGKKHTFFPPEFLIIFQILSLTLYTRQGNTNFLITF